MRKITEFLLSLFFSKEAIDLVKIEAAYEARTEMIKYENKKYLSKLKGGKKPKNSKVNAIN
jgi:hypothetical protein